MTEELDMIYDMVGEENTNSIEHLATELTKIRAGKATPSMLSTVYVDYYGSSTPLAQVANVNTPDGRTLTVQPWEKGMLQEIERSIINSNLGFAPQNNGDIIIISIPPLTEERRRDLVKQAKGVCENAKVSIRNHRRDANDSIKKLKNDGLPEDMMKDAEAHIQDVTNKAIEKIDALLVVKEKDIMAV